MMSKITESIIAHIARAVANGERIAPCTFTVCYPRANVSAAFRVARQRGLIVVDYASGLGTPVYRKALQLAKGGG